MTPPRISNAVLTAISAGTLTLGGLAEQLDCSRTSVSNAAQKLRRRGFITIPAPGEYRLTDAGRQWIDTGRSVASGQGTRTRKPSGLRARAWWVMVREKTFCLDGLLCTVATGDERGAEHNLRSYLNALEAAGIVTRIASPRGGNAPAYRLEPARAGRKAPIVRNTQRQVVCGVTGEVIDIRKEPHRG